MTSSVFCFSWDTSGIHFCETLSTSAATRNRTGVRGFIKSNCSIADFVKKLVKQIEEVKPAILFFSTQGGAANGSYLHSDVLIDSLSDIGFDLYKSRDSHLSLTLKDNVLRSSVFINRTVKNVYEAGEKTISKIHNNSQLVIKIDDGSSTARAIATYMKHDIYGSVALIAIHISHKGLNQRNVINLAAELLTARILQATIDTDPSPTRFILAGDFGYVINKDASFKTLEDFKKHDDLTIRLKNSETYSGVFEGINGKGLDFIPTSKMSAEKRKTCSDGTFDISCYDEMISWPDRILYGEKLESSYKYVCTEYDRFDDDSMYSSTHTAITANFVLKQQ